MEMQNMLNSLTAENSQKLIDFRSEIFKKIAEL